MVRPFLLMLVAAMIALGGGCAGLPSAPDPRAWACPACAVEGAGTIGEANGGKKGPKTLLEWAAGRDKGEEKKDGNGGDQVDSKSDKEDGKKAGNGEEKNGKENGSGKQEGKGNGNGNGKQEGKENGADEPSPLASDRPDFTESSTTVGKGRIQLEAGYTFLRDRENGTTARSHSYPEVLLRIGMFAEWFEVRVGQNLSSTRTRGGAPDGGPTLITGPSGGTAIETGGDASGAEDLYLGVKFALTEQKKWLPETALVLQMTVPTGSRDLSAEQVLPGINYLFGWDVIKDCLTLGGSFQANRSVDETGHYHVIVAQSLTVGYQLTSRLGAYTEWFALYPAGAVDPDTGPEHYFNGGVTFLVTDNFQLDARAGLGLNRHADDFFAGTGFVVRY